jgi:hypothetical protein
MLKPALWLTWWLTSWLLHFTYNPKVELNMAVRYSLTSYIFSVLRMLTMDEQKTTKNGIKRPQRIDKEEKLAYAGLSWNCLHTEQCSFVVRHHFYANPEPDSTFHSDADPDPDPQVLHIWKIWT